MAAKGAALKQSSKAGALVSGRVPRIIRQTPQKDRLAEVEQDALQAKDPIQVQEEALVLEYAMHNRLS